MSETPNDAPYAPQEAAAAATAEPWPVGRYVLTAQHYIALAPGGPPALQPRGMVIVYDQRPNQNMAPLDEAARSAIARRDIIMAPIAAGPQYRPTGLKRVAS